jgi:hypothetical protein
MDPQLSHKLDNHDVHLLDSGFVATTEVSPGAQVGSITQQSPAHTALAESTIDPGLNGTHDVAHE